MTYHTNDPSVTRIALAAFPSYRGKKFQLCSFDQDGTFTLYGNYWSGGSRHTYKLLRLDNLQTLPVPGQNPLRDAQAHTFVVPPGGAVVEHVIFCGKDHGLRLHVHEKNITKLLPVPKFRLQRDEKIVLAATVGIKSFARFDEAKYYTGITKERYESAKIALINAGLLNKRGAVTNEGRNAIGDVRLEKLREEKDDE